jgi:predicted HD phosphohydrolase
MTPSSKNRQVIHVHILNTDKHFYFGSISAMYDHFTSEQLSVASQTLYNKWKDEPYITDTVILRKGRLIQKEQHKNMKAVPKSGKTRK